MKMIKVKFTRKWIYDRFFRKPGTVMEVPLHDGLGLITRDVAVMVEEEDEGGEDLDGIQGTDGLDHYQD